MVVDAVCATHRCEPSPSTSRENVGGPFTCTLPPHAVATLKSRSTKEPVSWAWFPWKIPLAWPGVAFRWGEGRQTPGKSGWWPLLSLGGVVSSDSPGTVCCSRCWASSHATAVCFGAAHSHSLRSAIAACRQATPSGGLQRSCLTQCRKLYF